MYMTDRGSVGRLFVLLAVKVLLCIAMVEIWEVTLLFVTCAACFEWGNEQGDRCREEGMDGRDWEADSVRLYVFFLHCDCASLYRIWPHSVLSIMGMGRFWRRFEGLAPESLLV